MELCYRNNYLNMNIDEFEVLCDNEKEDTLKSIFNTGISDEEIVQNEKNW